MRGGRLQTHPQQTIDAKLVLRMTSVFAQCLDLILEVYSRVSSDSTLI